ncbi:hypothetical protein JCM3774_000541 [Rhodotorula dairenensis]
MARRARSASCSTPPKSPIEVEAVAGSDTDSTPLSRADYEAASFATPTRRKRSLTEAPLDKAQVDALVAAVQSGDRLVDQATPVAVVAESARSSLPTGTVSAWTSAPGAVPPTLTRSPYPISSARDSSSPPPPPPPPPPIRDGHVAYGLPYLTYDLSPGFAPLPPATTAPAFPSPTSPPGGPYPPVPAPVSVSVEASSRSSASYPFPALYYPVSGEANQYLPHQSHSYPLPPVEAYLPSPPFEIALYHPGTRAEYAPHAPVPGPRVPAHRALGHGAIGQPVPWQASPPRLASGLTYPISSLPLPTRVTHGLHSPPPPAVTANRLNRAGFGVQRSGGMTSSRGRQVHEHGSPNWSALRQQIQAGEHPRSRGTCKFFNPQTGFGYIIDDRAEELATDVFVHFTGIEQSRGFRCLSPGERVEYVLTQNSAGRVQALKVVGENGAQLLGLADPVQANRVRDAARKLSPTIDSGASDSSASSPASLDGVRPRKPRVVPIPPSKLIETNALGLISVTLAE